MIRIFALLALLFAAGVHADDGPPSLEALLESGKIDLAIESLEQELGDNPYDPVQLNNLAVARTRKGEVYTALDLLDRAARLAPNRPTIADNRKQLREWLAGKVGANADSLQASARPIPPSLPDPPALWAPGGR